MHCIKLPNARNIHLAPELASLALLHAALLVAEQALIAEHPTAPRHDEPRHSDPPTLALARDLIAQSAELRQHIAHYLHAIDRAADLSQAQHDEMPF